MLFATAGGVFKTREMQLYVSDRSDIDKQPDTIICMFMYPITDMQNRYLFTVIKYIYNRVKSILLFQSS